jgi:Flp pilus assembly protein TadD
LSYALKSEFYENKISRLKVAITALKKAYKINSTNYKTLGLLGRAYLTYGNTAKAELYLIESLDRKEDQPDIIS